MTTSPNFVLIFADQHRADALGCAGNCFVQTPCLDELAAEGTRFDRAFTPWPVCTPARASLWTSAYPHAHGIIDNVYDIDNAFESVGRIRTTVFNHLRQAGYATAHFGKWHLGEAKPDFFDVWEECFNSRQGHWIDGKLDGEYRPDVQTDASIAYLHARADQAAGQPFVMVQSYYPPHDPYTAPARFYAPYRGKGVPFAGYYAAVSALDWNVGRIVRTLNETGLRKNTMVIYFSDHGDTFFYRPEGEHKFVCTEDAIRVPLIVSMPGTVAAGAVSAQPVGLQDLAPTLLDFGGAPSLDPCHGRSLKPLLKGDGAQDWRQAYYVQNITHISNIEQRSWREEEWKLIASADGNHALYNLQADPEEELDVYNTPRPDPGFERFKHYPSYADVIERLRADALSFADSIGDGRGREILAAVGG